MNFEEAYQKLRDGTATDEEAAFVARELENVRKISAILDDPGLSSPGIGQAEADTVQRARKAFNKKTLVRTVVIVLCSLLAVAALVCGILFIPANISASGKLKISKPEAVEIARACLAEEVGEARAETFYVDYAHRHLRYVGSIFDAVYVYKIEFEDPRGSEYEIEVNAKRRIKESGKELHSMHQADMSFGMNKIEEYNATCLHDLLRRVPGVSVRFEKCYIRGAHSIYAENPAAIAINGVIQEDGYDLDLIQIQDVARLDIFKSGTTVIWGSRGGAGVISIILKDGTEIPRQTDQTNLKKFTPLGWQLPQDFFMQPYTDPAKRPSTLLWIPDVQSQVMSFSTDGHATVYDVVIEGVTSRGRLIREHTEIIAL